MLPLATSLRDGLNSLTRLANSDLALVWAGVTELAQEAGADPEDEATRSALSVALNDVLPKMIISYRLAAVALAADRYDIYRQQRVGPGFRAVTDLPGDPGVHQLIGWALSTGQTLNSAEVLLQGGMQRRIWNPARDVIMDSTVADPEMAGWRRVASGTTCDFCSMLIGRGAVYDSTTAGFRTHDNCDCLAEPAVAGAPTRSPAGHGSGSAGGGGTVPPVPGGTDGGGGWSDEYPEPENSSHKPPFRPSERPHISRGSRKHILDGHRYDGSRPSRFPEHWSDEDIMDAVDVTMAQPDRLLHFGDQYAFVREVRGRTVWVTVRVDKPRPFVWTAYPL